MKKENTKKTLKHCGKGRGRQGKILLILFYWENLEQNLSKTEGSVQQYFSAPVRKSSSNCM
jgi:hypothetical protein